MFVCFNSIQQKQSINIAVFMKTFLSNRASRFDFYISIKKVLLAQEKRYQVLSESIVYSYFLCCILFLPTCFKFACKLEHTLLSHLNGFFTSLSGNLGFFLTFGCHLGLRVFAGLALSQCRCNFIFVYNLLYSSGHFISLLFTIHIVHVF